MLGHFTAQTGTYSYFLIIQIQYFRYNLVYSCGIALTSIMWNNYRINEIVMALANNEVRCYDIGKLLLGFIF